MHLGYSLTLGARTAKLEKKNGKEMKRIEEVEKKDENKQEQINQLKKEVEKLKENHEK
jgi:hypothetical protein